MQALESILLVLLIADAIGLTVLVLMQQGRGADVGAAFGSGAANTVFGSAGSGSFLTKMTVWLSVGFFLIAFGLAYVAKERSSDTTIEGLPVVPTSDEAPVLESKADSTDNEAPGLTPKPEGVDSGVPEV
jgi:preprotein translocase subunit SecG